ncbi:unnamed protein product [Protopolystoma xenopodis]|uniref:Uncharacterized protein n=1 Tax=Protopolystoma xenopodis TaxID=117903 RepID=A0A3S5FG63_9PLAT|nr:unnamed protein product [Protopolystoma xenopodis]
MSNKTQPDRLIKHSDEEGLHTRDSDEHEDDDEDDDVPTPTTAETPGCVSTSTAVTDNLLQVAPVAANGDGNMVGVGENQALFSSLDVAKPEATKKVDISLSSAARSEDPLSSRCVKLNGLEADAGKTKQSNDPGLEKKTRRQLHKTTSIFFRSLPPSITRAELVEVFPKFDIDGPNFPKEDCL